MIHELKVWKRYFSPLVNGSKTFEMRENDRNFKPDDMLWLRETDPSASILIPFYTGQSVVRRVGYILEGGYFDLPEHMCVMSLLYIYCPKCDCTAFDVIPGDAIRCVNCNHPIERLHALTQ